MDTRPPIPSDAAAWDQARQAFTKSSLVDTPLASLSADLDVPPWPVVSPDETPAAYIHLAYPRAVAALAARGLPPAQLAALITILKDTLAFDQPFGAMMEDIETPAPGGVDQESPLFKNMARLDIPTNFPLALTQLSDATIDLCRDERVDTLGQFVGFASRLSQTIVVGGDFRELLNALAQKDETALARFLPFRPGTKGLHLAEALQHEARRLTPEERQTYAADPASIPAAVNARIGRIAAQFAPELATLREQVTAAPSAPLPLPLSEPALLPAIRALLRPHLPAAVVAPAPVPRRSFWQRLFGRR